MFNLLILLVLIIITFSVTKLIVMKNKDKLLKVNPYVQTALTIVITSIIIIIFSYLKVEHINIIVTIIFFFAVTYLGNLFQEYYLELQKGTSYE